MSPHASKPDLKPYLAAAKDLQKNQDQLEAYESKGHCVVLTGPGSGKTKVLTVKLARIISEDVAPPRGITCLTYNNECVKELTSRLALLGVRTSRNVFIGTVHSFCLKSVVLPYARMAGMNLSNPLKVAALSDQERLFSTALGRVVGINERSDFWRRRCDRYRRVYLDRDKAEWRNEDPELAALAEQYEAELRSEGFVDFDDMVLLGLKLIETQPWIRKALVARYPVLVVDEYQDLGLTLHRIVMSLCFGTGKTCRLFAVGDPDQSIYSFTGAQPELLNQLASDSRVQQIRLKLNYRSRKSIVSASEVALGEQRGYVSAAGDGGIIDFHHCSNGLQHQAKHICETLIPTVLRSRVARNLGEVAILYREKNHGDVAAEAATAAGLEFIRIDGNSPYRCTPLTMWLEGCAAWCSGGWKIGEPSLSDLLSRWRSFNATVGTDSEMLSLGRKLIRFLFSHRDTKDMLGAWLSSFRESCLREIFDREQMMSDEAVRFNNIFDLCKERNTLAGWSVARLGGQGGSPDHLNLMTLHSAKGLEFDVVFMLGMDQGIIPFYKEDMSESKQEPRRLFYVGLTRARFEVHMLYSGWYEAKGRRYSNGPSEFLLEVQRAISRR